MSIYIPYKSVKQEHEMQQKRRQVGLKDGTYTKYPNAEAVDHFVVKTSKLYAPDGQLHAKGVQLAGRMDKYLALVALQKADSVAPQEEEK